MPNPHGRPSPPPGEALDTMIHTRVKKTDLAAWQAEAKRRGVSLSTWIRMSLNSVSKQRGKR